MPGLVCTCRVVTHVAIGLIFQAGTHREIQRSPDCEMHRCAECEGRGFLLLAGPTADALGCKSCRGSGLKP